MFGQLMPVRLRAAEKALREGRLDEAFRLAASPDLHKHQRAVAVLEVLATRFLERARAYFREDHCEEALSDLGRAAACGAKKEELAELRRHVEAVAVELKRQAESRRERLEAVRRRVERGSLAAGQRILEHASQEDPRVNELREDIARRACEVTDIVRQAEVLMKQGQLAAAAERVRRAKALESHGDRVTAVEADLCQRVLGDARRAIIEGRVGRAADELLCLGNLGDGSPAKRDVTDVLRCARDAGAALVAGQYGEARRAAMTLTRLIPEAKWVKEAVRQLEQMDDLRTSLMAGPLADGGWHGDPAAKLPRRHAADLPAQGGHRTRFTPVSFDETLALPPRRGRPGANLPERLLLLVDGGGSYLLLTGSQASIGRAASEKPADVSLFSDIAERQANIVRVEEDYFLFSTKQAEVAGRRTNHQLLRDGDRIVLGRKAKFTFRVPSRASATAVLDLSDTTKMPQDVRRVVLFDRHAVIGQGGNVHVTCHHASPALVLFERDGALWLRPKNDGHVAANAVELKLGEPTEVGGVSLVIEPWRSREADATPRPEPRA